MAGTEHSNQRASNFAFYYRFDNPGKVHIRTCHPEEAGTIDTTGLVWEHDQYGRVDWRRLKVDPSLSDLIRHYVFYKLETSSPRTGFSAARSLIKWQKEISSWPGQAGIVASSLCNVKVPTHWVHLCDFYDFSVSKSVPGFERQALRELKRLRRPSADTLVDARSLHRSLLPEEERRLVALFDGHPQLSSDTLRDECMVQVCWELGLRPVQIRALEERHLISLETPDGAYFSLDVLRAKKRHVDRAYRRRAISSALGEKLLVLMAQNRQRYGNGGPDKPLFRTRPKGMANMGPTKFLGGRLAQDTTAVAIASYLQRQCGLGKRRSPNTLRHHLAQKLADLGAPQEVVAEMLDHSDLSTVQSYVRARANIADIKARALGLNEGYGDLLAWLTGRQPIASQPSPAVTSVQGLVANRYIGNIGVCGLPGPHQCPKNPVYACYGCRDFTPFIDGEHGVVADAMAAEHVALLADAEPAVNPIAIQNEYPIAVARAVQALCDARKEAQ